MQACLLTTFVIVALSTVAFVIAQSILQDVVHTAGMSADAAVHATEPGLALLRNSFTFVGALLIAFAAATAFLLARQVTNPLRDLAAKVSALRPGDASRRTVDTGDEVETLDGAFVDMAGRLAKVHERQEEEIASRTADLRRQYEMDHVILDSIHLGVMTVDRSGIVALANPAAAELLSREDAVGKNVSDVLLVRRHGGSAIDGPHPVSQCLESGAPFRTAPSTHWSIERPDKGLIPISLSIVPLRDGERSFGALVMFQNVSEERHIDYLKSEFITLASHQLRTPLSAIRWYAELLGDSAAGLSGPEKEYVQEIDRSVRRMITLLGALLHAARIEDETVNPSMVDTNLVGLVQEALRDEKDILETLSVGVAADLPSRSVMVRTDPVLLRVVLQNLLSNAAKYSPKGSTISVGLAVDGGEASVSVRDQGMGIPKADQERIFEKFFRAQNVRQIDTDGNGLGLYISKSIVDRLHGRLSFVSDGKTGTTFTVTLPIAS